MKKANETNTGSSSSNENNVNKLKKKKVARKQLSRNRRFLGKKVTKKLFNPRSYAEEKAEEKAVKEAARKAQKKAEKNKFEKIKKLVKEHKSNIPSVLKEVNRMNENNQKKYLSNKDGKIYSSNEIREKDEDLREIDFKYNLQKLGKFFSTSDIKKILQLTGNSFISSDQQKTSIYKEGLTNEQKENPWVSPYMKIMLNSYNENMLRELITSTNLQMKDLNLLLELSMLSYLSKSNKNDTQSKVNDLYKKLRGYRDSKVRYKNEPHLKKLITTIDIKENNNSEKSTNKSVIDYEWNLKNRFLDKGIFITIIFFYCKCVSEFWESHKNIKDDIRKLLIIFNQQCIEYIFLFLAPVYNNRYHEVFIKDAPYLIKASRKKSKTEILQQKDGFLKSTEKYRIAQIELDYSDKTYILTSHKVPIGSKKNNNAKLVIK
jgi:hypothetical protein